MRTVWAEDVVIVPLQCHFMSSISEVRVNFPIASISTRVASRVSAVLGKINCKARGSGSDFIQSIACCRRFKTKVLQNVKLITSRNT